MTPTAFEVLIPPSCLAVVAGLAMGSFAATMLKAIGAAVPPGPSSSGSGRAGR